MSNVRALYYKAKTVRRRITLASMPLWFVFMYIVSHSLIGALIASIFFGIVTWWACSQEVERWGSIYHIGER